MTFKGDSLISKSYIKGQYIASTANQEDEFKIVKGQFSKGYSKEYYNLGFGGYGYFGNSRNVEYPDFFKNQYNFVGLGATAEASVSIPIEDVINWRIIGGKLSVSWESDSYKEYTNDYIRFRKEEKGDQFNDDLFYSDNNYDVENLNPDNFSLNLSAFSEILFKVNDDVQFGFSTNFGVGHRIITLGIGSFLQYKKFILSGNLGSAVQQNSYTSLSLTYQL